MRNKKILAILLTLVMAISVLASCGPKDEKKEDSNTTENTGDVKGDEENQENNDSEGTDSSKAVPTAETADIPTGGEPDSEQYINTFLGAQPNTLDPSKGSDLYGNGVLMNVLEPLVRIGDKEDARGEVEYYPAGAESWEVSEDGLTYTFHLRDNQWNDGQPVTSKDYAYGILRSALPETVCPYANMVYYVKGAEDINKAESNAAADTSKLGVATPDDKTLEITLNSATPYFLDIVTQRVFLPQREDLVEMYGDVYSTAPENTPQCGPFILSDWIINSELNYKKNENYWDAENVKLNIIRVKVIQDVNTIFNALKTGEIDYASVNDPKWKAQFLDDPNFYAFTTNNADCGYFMTNAKDEHITRNNKIRQAISIALDRQELIDATLNGVGIPAFDFVPPAIACQGEVFNVQGEGWVSKLQEENPDPRALFVEGCEELGINPDEAVINFLGSGVDQSARTMTEFIQQNLEEKLGCKLEVVNKEWNQFMNEVNAGNYDVAWLAWNADFNDPSNFLETCYSPAAIYDTGWVNEDFDKKIEEARKELDPQKRIEILHEAEKILVHDDAAIIPINHRVSNVFRRSYIRNGAISFFSTMGFKRMYTSGR